MEEKTMNVRELAVFFGKSEATIRRAGHNLNIQVINGKEQRFNKDDVEAISDLLFTKCPFAVKEAIEHTFSKVKAEPLLNEKALTVNDIPSIVAETIKQLMPLLQNNQVQKPEVKQLPAAIKTNPRNVLRKILNEYSFKTGIEYNIAYNGFYNDIYYHLGKNVKLLATRNEIKTIDMIDKIDNEEPGFWDKVINLANTFFSYRGAHSQE